MPASSMNPWGSSFNPFSIGGATSGIAGILNGMTFKNPADAANPYFDKMGGMLKDNFSPYINNGLNAGNTLMDSYGKLMQDPGGFLNNMGKNYQQSPGYQFKVDQATNAANRAAAAGGMQGSPMEQQELATTVTGLADQDYYNWLNQATGMFGMGMKGNQDMYQTGFQGASTMSELMAQMMMAQAKNAYMGQQAENQNTGGSIGSALGGLGTLAYGLAL